MVSSNSYPRDIAVRVLTRVLSDHMQLEDALAGVSGEVTPEARAWLQEVCSGTLRWKGRLDFVIDSNALKKKPSGWLRKILLISAYQLVVQERANPSRVVSETVNEVKKKEGEAPSKFANALLRKIAEHALTWRNLELQSSMLPAQAASWASLPAWLWNKLEKQQGREFASQYAVASMERPKLWLRSKKPELFKDYCTAGPIPESFQVSGQAPSGPVPQWPGFQDGLFFVQDISSQMLVHGVTEEVKKTHPGQITALDLCAAPGGKSVGMAWSGMRVTASDLDPSRLELLKQTVERVAPAIKIISKSEVQNLPQQDLVWVDAPCTGTGILRRHPDVRWLKQEADLLTLKPLQEEVFKEGWAKVKNGGYLAYSVCSVLQEEGPVRVEKLGFKDQVVKDWFMLPQGSPSGDGFWCALIRKA